MSPQKESNRMFFPEIPFARTTPFPSIVASISFAMPQTPDHRRNSAERLQNPGSAKNGLFPWKSFHKKENIFMDQLVL
jgi:hypothetical protein